MFQFSGFTPAKAGDYTFSIAGLPHSEICGLIRHVHNTRSLSQLITSFIVSDEPRHPPYALI